jgi:hypothetical protein
MEEALMKTNLTKEPNMTLIIFISACLLSYGAFELKEAIKPTNAY